MSDETKMGGIVKLNVRLRVAIRIFAVFILGSMLSDHAANAATVCGNQSCKSESQHPTSYVAMSDGMGHTYYMYDVDPAGLVQAAKKACSYYSAARSNASYTYTFNNTCLPVLPIPDPSAGGSWGTIAVSGTLSHVRNSDGAVISTTTSEWSLLTPGCNDSINSNLVALGTNGQCYCNYGYSWATSLNACVSVLDRWYNYPGTCPAGEPRYGKPIAPLVGAKIVQQDLGISIGREGLGITYDSRSKVPYATSPTVVNGAAAVAAVPPVSFGGLWTSSAHKSLYIQRNGSGSAGFVVQAYRGDGQFITFTHPTTKAYVPSNPRVREQLVPVLDASGNPTSQVRLVDPSGNIELYDMYNLTSSWQAVLLSITYVDGGYVNYSYSTAVTPVAPYAGLLIGMTDNQGRTVKFQYESVNAIPSARLKQITATDGRLITFSYDVGGNLSQINWTDGRARKYLYERTDLPWAVTGVIDENNSRFSTYTYDAQGRAIGTQQAGGIDSYSVSYSTPPMLSVTESLVGSLLVRDHVWTAPQNASVVLPNGSQSNLSSTTISGMPVLTGQTQPAGSGCAAANNASTFDTNGNVLSRDDFLGQRTCYVYDSGNRETVRVEGLATAVPCSAVTPSGATLPVGARKITTTWHPDWRKRTQVVEPKSQVSTVYHGQPDPFNNNAIASCTTAANLLTGKPMPVVCKQVERATLDSGGIDPAVPARTATYTYDAAGRVLTSTDANSRTTGYSYFTDSAFSGNPSGSYDPDYDLVQLLLHGNGANGAMVIPDDSTNHFSLMTAVGNANISTAQSVFGGSSVAFDGAGDYLLIPYSPAFAFGSGDFTIETFLYKNANNSNSSRIWNPNGDHYDGVVASIDGSGNFAVYLSTTGSSWNFPFPVVANLANGQWYHLAITRSGGSVFAFVNGVRYTITTALGATPLYTNTTYARVIGGQSGVDRALNGYIDEFRITKGVARYTADFTPPTQEFPSHGLVLSPTDIGHTVGDLQSITNPAGHVTQFTQYDRAGRVRQMIDPKGLVTDISYTPRGWVSTVTTTAPGGAGRTTSYSYDGVGQLTGVTQPDGTSLSYSYDAAHRLVGVTDAKGNAVSYTLDNVGNRINEEIKDPTGTLQRSIARSFDALNRLQQVTGAAR